MKPKAIKAYFTRFTVTGVGQFPFDMLRHDNAWPATSADARELSRYGLKRTITLICAKAHPGQPNIERWMSIGWKVGEAEA